jgi:hypothetical protein
MDAERFDGIAKRLSRAGTRRGFVRLLAGLPLSGALAALLGAGREGADAESGDHGSAHRRQRRKARHKHGQAKKQRRRKHDQRGKNKDKDKDKRKPKQPNNDPPPGKDEPNGNDEPGGGNPPPDNGCQPASPAETCDGACGMVADRCGTLVDCGPCGCEPPCGPCLV